MLIQELKDRIARVNGDDEYAFTIETAVVFGSALDERERLGDVDVAIKLAPRHADSTMYEAAYRRARAVPQHTIEQQCWV